MATETLVLTGRLVCLEPLDHSHVEGLAAASSADPALYQWSPVPQGKAEATRYVDTALAWCDAGTALSAKFEGILRSHRMAADFIARDSARFSIVAAEWPDVKSRLNRLLDQKR